MADKIHLDFKSTNKWLWDRYNRTLISANVRVDEVTQKLVNNASIGQPIFKVERVANRGTHVETGNSSSQTLTAPQVP